ncbi:hydroxyethylthiazole kinase [Arthrobacter sp. NamB2]|uniref:hydroxyethylthiazole kinase n=1 Tax=Arthrobacter sp. NamB2 TaxID=2576035 RepID=UPI0010C942F1|nr:hydroxyethylthiazole kinase [Arthrobacter sp. NamB2]TKV28132.1 hydroxyethylthiazole kinase [Arthrobacter sp. NamB2]
MAQSSTHSSTRSAGETPTEQLADAPTAASVHPASVSPDRPVTAEACAELLGDLRRAAPLVQCVTNAVVTNFTANVLLALGAAPAMVDIPGEAAQFAPVASGVLVNLGTPTESQRAAMLEAAEASLIAGTPWVLDPVAVGFLSVRTATAQRLVTFRPTIIRGNASEIIALAGSGAGGRGVDSLDEPAAALDAARLLGSRHGSVVAVSGAVDAVVAPDGAVVRVANGSAMLTRVTGGGCALGAVMAAFASLTPDALLAATAATAAYTLAAERAASTAAGPGTFAPHFLDALAAITPADVVQGLNLSDGD